MQKKKPESTERFEVIFVSLLSHLTYERKQKKKELETYRNRKSKTEKIKNSVNKDFDDNISSSIKNNERSSLSLISGIQGDVKSISMLGTDIDMLKEKYVWNDGNMSYIASNLESEISRCRMEIERLEAEIRRLNKRIEAARKAESEGE